MNNWNLLISLLIYCFILLFVTLYSKLLVYLQMHRISYVTHCFSYVMHTWLRYVCQSGGLADARCHPLACCASVAYLD